MGAVTFSIDVSLAAMLRDALTLDLFVETGTFEGKGIETVRPLFREIHSVDISPTYYEQAHTTFAEEPDIHVHLGESQVMLEQLRPAFGSRRTLFWLDAHWCGDPGGEGRAQCPLLDELTAIETLNEESALLIDDARLFLATPPVPHSVEQWPRLQEVLDALGRLSDLHELMVINDVLVFYPKTILAHVERFAHEHGVDWLAWMHDRDALAVAARERLAALDEKEEEIRLLAAVAAERLELIEKLSQPQRPR